MQSDLLSSTLASKLADLANDESAQDWMKALFEKRPSAGFLQMSRDPVDLVADLLKHKSSNSTAFSKWVAQCLDRVPGNVDFDPMDIPQENLLEGLFRWCSYRPDPKRYASKLLSIEQTTQRTVANGWTANLKRSFKHALILNQESNALQNLWMDLLDGTKGDHGFQRYWPDDFEGLLHMPAADEGTFAWAAIGQALKSIFETLLPGHNQKSISPSGPIRDLYRRIGSIADLDEPDLSSKLWDLAKEVKWGKPQQLTIPRQFFLKPNGDLVLPRVALTNLLQWKNLKVVDMNIEMVAILPAAESVKLSVSEKEVIETYETDRQNSPRPYREAMFNGTMATRIPRKTLTKLLLKNKDTKRLTPGEIIHLHGSSILEQVRPPEKTRP
jgi:hypothetical protein